LVQQEPQSRANESFLVLFFKKEPLAFPYLTILSAAALDGGVPPLLAPGGGETGWVTGGAESLLVSAGAAIEAAGSEAGAMAAGAGAAAA
jgi:hypothetical protein